MKERDYINVRELSNVLAMTKLLRDITQANSEVITEEQYKTVGEILFQWQIKLFKKVKVKQVKNILMNSKVNYPSTPKGDEWVSLPKNFYEVVNILKKKK